MNAERREPHLSAMHACSRAWLRRGALAAVLCVAPAAAGACGLEDPSSIATLRGALNQAYPESLHVGTAVWQAQLAGRLPQDPLAKRGDLAPQARAAMRLARAETLLHRFAARLAGDAAVRPSLAVVLIGPVLWSRIDAKAGTKQALVHVDGPEADDVVVVTDIAAIEAIAAGSLSFADALNLGLLRLYGNAADIAAARGWLTGGGRG